ncbi:MAG: amidohydrolase family protein [Chloroflexi bacterium]|nr:amidohydrolase family protein [Chloroflexota bacterium]
MTSSLIRGKYVITCVLDDHSSEIITDGAVYQEDGAIVEVGPYADLRAKYDPDQYIGDGKQVLMPGLINDHHHVGITPFQFGNPDLSLETWGATRLSTRYIDSYLDTLYGAIDMIEHGVTSVVHMCGPRTLIPGLTVKDMAVRAISAYQEIGMRAAFSYLMRDQNRFVYQDDETFLATLPSNLADPLRAAIYSARVSLDDYETLVRELSDQFAGDPRVTMYLSPTNVQWCSDDLLGLAKQMASRYDIGMHIHLQETIYQRMYGMKKRGKTPLAHLYDLGFLGPDVTCGHSAWLSDGDIDLIQETDTIVCHNASSNLRLKSGIAPVNRLIEKGVTIAMGIDEAGLNDDKDIFQEMRLAQKIHRVPGVLSPVPTSHQVLQMATMGGAKALKMADRVGSLEAGKRADLILVDMDRMLTPYLDPRTNIVDAVLHRARGVDVQTVLIDGEVVMRDRVLTKVDKRAVLQEIADVLGKDLAPHEVARRQASAEFVPYVERFYAQWDMELGTPHQTYNAV